MRLLNHRDQLLNSGMLNWLQVTSHVCFNAWYDNYRSSVLATNMLRVLVSVLHRVSVDVQRRILRLLNAFRENFNQKARSLFIFNSVLLKWLAFNLCRSLQIWSERFRLETAFEMALVNKKQKDSLEMEKNSEIYKCKQDKSAALMDMRRAQAEQERLRAQLDEMIGKDNAEQKVLLEAEAKQHLLDESAAVTAMVAEAKGKRDDASAAEEQAKLDSVDAKNQIEEIQKLMPKAEARLEKANATVAETAAQLAASQAREKELTDSLALASVEAKVVEEKAADLEIDLSALEQFVGLNRKEIPTVKEDNGPKLTEELEIVKAALESTQQELAAANRQTTKETEAKESGQQRIEQLLADAETQWQEIQVNVQANRDLSSQVSHCSHQVTPHGPGDAQVCLLTGSVARSHIKSSARTGEAH